MLQTLFFNRDQPHIQRPRQPRGHLLLHVEQIADGLVEPFGPKMSAGFSVNEPRGQRRGW